MCTDMHADMCTYMCTDMSPQTAAFWTYGLCMEIVCMIVSCTHMLCIGMSCVTVLCIHVLRMDMSCIAVEHVWDV